MGRQDGEVNLIEVGRGKVEKLAGQVWEPWCWEVPRVSRGQPGTTGGRAGRDSKWAAGSQTTTMCFIIFSIRFLRNNLHKVKFTLLKYTC